MSNKSNSSDRVVPVRIHASVSTMVNLDGGESPSDLKNRAVDIFLHGAGEQGHINKEDMGADSYRIVTNAEEEMVLVNKGFLLALIDTAKRTTFLEAVYDDERKTDYDWVTLADLIDGMSPEEIQNLTPPIPTL